MSKTVYVYCNGLVKIVERAGKYSVYRLDNVEVSRKGKHTYTFEKRPVETWSYKPYEDADVCASPEPFFEDVKRMDNYKVRLSIF